MRTALVIAPVNGTTDILATASREWLDEIAATTSRADANEAVATLVHRITGWTTGVGSRPRDVSMGEALLLLDVIREAARLHHAHLAVSD